MEILKKKILHKKLDVLWKIKIWCNKSIHSTNETLQGLSLEL